MSQVILKHLDALAAQMQLGLAQIDAMRHALQPPPVPPSARVERPERCQGVMPERCALVDGEWDAGRATLGRPELVRCRGCGHEQDRATGS